MVATRASSPETDYYSAQSYMGSPLHESDGFQQQDPSDLLQGGENLAIGVSYSRKRQHKDKRIYVNARTGLPVRPPTSFGLYKHALRRSIRDKVGYVDFHRRAVRDWTQMSDEQKEPFVRRAKQLYDHFRKIEARYLRRKVRQLQKAVKDCRESIVSSSASSRRRVARN